MATDPRPLGGAIAGPGGPRDKNAFVIDATHGVLLDGVEVVVVEPRRGDVPQPVCLAMLLSGRVNHTTDRADVLFMFDVDGAAAIVTELIALGARMDGDALASTIQARLAALAGAGALPEGGQ